MLQYYFHESADLRSGFHGLRHQLLLFLKVPRHLSRRNLTEAALLKNIFNLNFKGSAPFSLDILHLTRELVELYDRLSRKRHGFYRNGYIGLYQCDLRSELRPYGS